MYFTHPFFKKLPVMPMLHGTVEQVAWKICQAGFSTVATLDDGYYGKGMYFTNSLDYALTYAKAVERRESGKTESTLPYRVVVVAFVLPGNTYPVTDDPIIGFDAAKKGIRNDKGFMGNSCRSGYQSHMSLGKNASKPIEVALEPPSNDCVF